MKMSFFFFETPYSLNIEFCDLCSLQTSIRVILFTLMGFGNCTVPGLAGARKVLASDRKECRTLNANLSGRRVTQF